MKNVCMCIHINEYEYITIIITTGAKRNSLNSQRSQFSNILDPQISLNSDKILANNPEIFHKLKLQVFIKVQVSKRA